MKAANRHQFSLPPRRIWRDGLYVPAIELAAVNSANLAGFNVRETEAGMKAILGIEPPGHRAAS